VRDPSRPIKSLSDGLKKGRIRLDELKIGATRISALITQPGPATNVKRSPCRRRRRSSSRSRRSLSAIYSSVDSPPWNPTNTPFAEPSS
jgi:hypothetical protein